MRLDRVDGEAKCQEPRLDLTVNIVIVLSEAASFHVARRRESLELQTKSFPLDRHVVEKSSTIGIDAHDKKFPRRIRQGQIHDN